MRGIRRRGNTVILSGLTVAMTLAVLFSILPTPRYEKAMPAETLAASGMIITEFRDSPNGYEQVEIYNQGTSRISMVGWTLVIDGTSISLSPLGNVYSKYYRAIGDPYGSHLRIDITLGDEGGCIKLMDPVNNIVDSICYGQLGIAPDPVSMESVERVPSGDSYTDQWTRAQVSSFGKVNAGRNHVIDPQLVLNEVLFNAQTPGERFIELLYKGSGTLNIGGYKVVGDTVYTCPSITLTTLEPYAVIFNADATALFSGMDSTGDNLYLYTSYGSFMDMVGWSSTHTQGLTVARVPDGNGTATGYNDTSSVDAGWRFDSIPTLPKVSIGPRQKKNGELGERVTFNLTVKNKHTEAAYVNIEATPGSQGWLMSLLREDGVTPLPDSAGDPDAIPDVGLLGPGNSTEFKVAVQIPSVAQTIDWETGIVTATFSNDPSASTSTSLLTTVNPYIWPTASVDPSTIWVVGSPPGYDPKEATLTLNITGHGIPISISKPQDAMLLIDSSGSMTMNDPSNLRLDAAKRYVDLMTLPDRAAVIDFDQDAVLVNGDHLCSDYGRIKQNIDTIDSDGWTNLYDPIRIATNELIANGDPSSTWVEILLTDGQDSTGHTDTEIKQQAQRAAQNGITIFTIGLVASGSVNEPLLQDVANITGGLYLKADKPEDLDKIYEQISWIVKYPDLAGFDDDVTDNVPMVNLFLPYYIEYVGSSAVPSPDYVGLAPGGSNIQWNISELKINQTWTANLTIRSIVDGIGIQAMAFPSTIVNYRNYENLKVQKEFPETLIDVLSAEEGKICGCKWYDLDRDGIMDNSEPPIDGFRIQLYNSSGLLETTHTNSTGEYCFTDLDAGDYTVEEVMPVDPDPSLAWVQTYPGGDGFWVITLSEGEEVLNISFGNVVEFTESRTWGYWKTHTGMTSPPRDAAYDLLPTNPLQVDLVTPDGDDLIETDSEARWMFTGAGTGKTPNCSGNCRSLFRVQLLALHMSTLKFMDMANMMFHNLGGTYDGWIVRDIVLDGVLRLLNEAPGYSFADLQEELDMINNNHNMGLGSHVLVLPTPPSIVYP